MEVKRKALYVPPLSELASVLETGLTKYYRNVSVKVERVDEETLKQWGVVGRGLCNENDTTGAILDVGGVNNIHYKLNHDKYCWDVDELAKQAGIDSAFILGAGASDGCCELIANTQLGPQGQCGTHTAAVDSTTGACILRKHEKDPKYRSLSNLYASRGLPGSALRVEVSVALVDKLSLISAMRSVLREKYDKDHNIALGGIFRVLSGAIKSHIMPCYPPQDLETTEQVNEWLKFYEPVCAPLTCMSIQVAHDIEDWELRCEHTHFFGDKEGGHYHYDVTPSEIHYIGYFVPATQLIRIDQSRPPSGGKTTQPH